MFWLFFSTHSFFHKVQTVFVWFDIYIKKRNETFLDWKRPPTPPIWNFFKKTSEFDNQGFLSLISVFTFKRCLWYVQPPYELTHRTYATTSSPPTLWPCSAFPSSSSPSSTSASSKSSRFTVNIQCSFAKKLSKQKFWIVGLKCEVFFSAHSIQPQLFKFN